MPETLQKYTQMIFQQPVSGAEDSHARISALQEKEKDLMEKGQDYSLNLLGLSEKPPRKVDPITYSLKTLETFYQSVRDLTSLPFSLNWTKSGMMQNGTLSTVPMWPPKTDKEYSLLDIIEQEVHEKYFLSKEQTERLLDEYVEQRNKLNQGHLQQVIGGSQGNRVYAVSGKSSCLSANGGGQGAKTGLYMFFDLSNKYPRVTDAARCIQARYQKGSTNRKGEISGVMILQSPRGKNTGGLHEIAPTLTSNSWDRNNHICIPCITPNRESKRQNGRRFKNDGELMFTLTAQDIHGFMLANKEYILIRRLTPKECFRLQTFTDEQFELASTAIVNNKPISDSQLYKMAGNAVTAVMIREIAK